MKRLYLSLIGSLFGTMLTFCPAQVSAEDGNCSIFGFDTALNFSIGGGYRQDKIKWSANSIGLPEFKTLEKWDHLHTGIVDAKAELLICESLYMQANFDYGWFDDNGTQTIRATHISDDSLSYTVHASPKGRLYDLSGALGYQFNMCCYKFGFTPLAGYSYHHQKLSSNHYREAHQHVAEDESEKSDIDVIKTHNTYNGHWSGPLAGFTTFYQIDCDWKMGLAYAYHYARFQNTVRENFSSLGSNRGEHVFVGKQTSNWGNGHEFFAYTSYEFSPFWILGLNYNFKEFKASGGSLKYPKHRAKIHDISWKTWNATMDIGYIF